MVYSVVGVVKRGSNHDFADIFKVFDLHYAGCHSRENGKWKMNTVLYSLCHCSVYGTGKINADLYVIRVKTVHGKSTL